MKEKVFELLFVMVGLLATSLCEGSDNEVEKQFQRDLQRSASIIERIIKGNAPAKDDIDRLKVLSERIRTSDLLLQARFREREEVLKAKGPTVRKRHRSMEEGYRKELEEYLNLVKGLEPSATNRQEIIESLRSLLNKMLPRKKGQILGALPYRNLNYPARQPSQAEQVTPAYKGGDSLVTSDDMKSTDEAPITGEIASLAESLGWNPVSIYEYVKNNIETEWYWGCMKGAEDTLHQKSGNDCDQAALLTALLRASGFPTRYVRGTIEFFPNIEKAKNLTGINDVWKIAEFFQKAGIPYIPVISEGKISNFEIEHIWVESEIPYDNYRGVILDESGKTWLGLDTSIKIRGYVYNSAMDLFQQTSHSDQLSAMRDEYLSSMQTQTPLEYLKEGLSASGGQQSVEEYKQIKTLIADVMNILPASMQFEEKRIINEYTAIPDDLKHRVHFVASDPKSLSPNTLFDITFNSYELSGQKIAISYEPETVEDQEIIDSYGGLDNTPAYLVRLRPVLKLNGAMVVVGKEGLPMGEEYDLTVELIAPDGTERTTSTQITGNLVAIVIISQKAMPYVSPFGDIPPEDDDAETMLYKEAMNYINHWTEAEDEFASLLHLAITRPIPSVVAVGGVIDVTYVLDTPHGFEWKGVYVDAELHAIEMTPSGSALSRGKDEDRGRAFMQLSALQGSILENRIFEDDFGVDSISTAKLFQNVWPSCDMPSLPGSCGIITIDATNIDSALPSLGLENNIREDIINAANQGLVVRIPQSLIPYRDWTGIGYIKENPRTGEAGYMLSGVIAGGMTAISPEEWAAQYLSDLLGRPYTAKPSTGPVAKIIKVLSTDRQYGIVGKPLDSQLAVLALDKKFLPVKGAMVTLKVKAGGGKLQQKNGDGILEGQEFTVTTGSDGIAKITLVSGKSTADNPFYLKIAPNDQFDTRVGLNLVTASVDGPSGRLEIQQPFEAYARPDKPVKIEKRRGDGVKTLVNNPAGSLLASVLDQYDNPVSNVELTFEAMPAVSNEPAVPLPSTYRNIQFYSAANCSNPYPLYGECAPYQATATVKTDSFGAMVNAVLGNTVNTRYTVSAIGANLSPTSFALYSAGFRNRDDYIPPGVYVKYLYPTNDKGEPINASKAGTELKAPLTSELFMLYDDYTMDGPRPCSNNATVTCWKIVPSGIINVKPLVDGTVTYSAVQGGGTLTATENLGNGKYGAVYTTGPVPMENKVQATGSATIRVPEVLANPSVTNIVVPSYSDTPDPSNPNYRPLQQTAITEYSAGSLQCLNGRCTLPERNVSLNSGQQVLFYGSSPSNELRVAGNVQTADYKIYGVDINVDIQPAIIEVDTDGYSVEDTAIEYAILPPEYAASFTDIDIFRKEERNDETWLGYIAGNATQGEGEVTLAGGTKFDMGKRYEVQSVLNGGSDNEVRGDRVPLALFSAASSPFELDRTYYLSRFNPDIPWSVGDIFKDRFKSFSFRVSSSSSVSLKVFDSDKKERGSLINRTTLSPGDYNFVVDYQSVLGFGFKPATSPAFYLLLSVESNDGNRSQTVYPGRLSERVEGKMLGQTIVHDVLIQDGSLNLSRRDVALRGRGPQFDFVRSYSNQSSGGGPKPLGDGWSHSFDMKLHPVSSAENGINPVPDWVNALKGRFYTASDVPSTLTRWTAVQVNGTLFKKYGGRWYAERGRHGTLEETVDHFVYTSKDGTRYVYAYPYLEPTALQKIEDRNGNIMTLTYSSGRLDTVTDAVGRSFAFEYVDKPGAIDDDNALLVKVSGPDGIDIIFTYDEKGYLESVTRDRRTETYRYEQEKGVAGGDYNLVEAIDSNKNSFRYEYYGPGEVDANLVNYTKVVKAQDILSKVIYPDGNFARFRYESQPENRRTVTDLRGHDTSYILNFFGNPLRIEEPMGKVTTMTWSIDEGKEDNVMTSRTDSRKNTAYYHYDPKGNIDVETDPYSNAITTRWNQTFNLPEVRTDRNKTVQNWRYDENTGDLLEYRDGDGKLFTYTYWATGERKTMTNPRLSTTSYTYDSWGNPDMVSEPEGSVTDYDYDIRGRRVAIADPNKNQTIYTYDNLDYPAAITYPEIKEYSLPSGSANVKTFVCDAAGNLLSETNRTGLALTYTYTSRNQVETITRNIGGEKSFGYDENGNLVSETDWKGVPTTHSYNDLNQRATTTNRFGTYTMNMIYDTEGNLKEVSDYEGNKTNYEYDALNRLTDTWQPALPGQERGNIHNTYYNEGDPKANLKTETDEEGNTTAYEYNGRYLRTKRTNALLDTYVWAYDDSGNLSSETDEENNATWYEYDTQNRRTFMHKTLEGRDIKTEYRYDLNGNLGHLIDPLARDTETQYDGWNRAWRVIDADKYETRTEYDGEGNKYRVVDGNGHSRTWEHDPRGLVTTYTDGEDIKTLYTYDYNGNVETITHDLTNEVEKLAGQKISVTRNTYDLEDRLWTTTEAVGTMDERAKEIIERDGMGNPLKAKDFNGNITRTEYNALNLPWRVYDPSPSSDQYAETQYYKTGKVKSVRNRRGFPTSYQYDALNREKIVTDTKGQTIETTYNKVGKVKTVKDKRGIVTENFYDGLYRLEHIERNKVLLVTNEYDDVGNLSFVTDAEGNRTENTYNNRNLLETTIYPDTHGVTRRYDGVGNLLVLTDEEEKDTTYTYDKENRQTSVEFAGEKASKAYDAAGNLTSITKPKYPEHSREMTYDYLGRLKAVIDDPGGLNLTTRYGYDGNGNLRHQYDARNSHVEFTYDALNRKTEHIQHKASGDLVTRYKEYDQEGNLTDMVDAKGQAFSYAYDELNRQTDVYYPDVPTPYMEIRHVHTEYDPNSNISLIAETKTAADGNTVTDTTVNVYGNFDRLTDSTERGLKVHYEYYNNGNRKIVSTPSGSTFFTYDGRNRLITAEAGSHVTRYTYYPDGKKDTISYPNGASVKYTYFPTNRVETVINKAGDSIISSYTYEYDKNGNRTSQIEIQNGQTETTSYGYDKADRLQNITVTGADITRTEYTFEGYNRKTEKAIKNSAVVGDSIYTSDETDWLRSVANNVQHSAISYEYDDNGNMIFRSNSLLPSGDMTFDFDSRNKLVEARRGPPGSEVVLGMYDYNADGMRIRHRLSERGNIDYYYDDKSVIEEHNAADGSILAHYRYGDRLISLQIPATGQFQYYHYDSLGSTVNLTNSDGNVAASYWLDPWGNIKLQLGASINRHIFTSQETDQRTGLIYFGARYYDPDTARFITEDSYPGEQNTPPSLNRYLYAYSNPTVYVDLLGYEAEEGDGRPSLRAAPEETFVDKWIINRQDARDAYYGLVYGLPVGGYSAEHPRIDAVMRLGYKAAEAYEAGQLIGTATHGVKGLIKGEIEKIEDKMAAVIKKGSEKLQPIVAQVKDKFQQTAKKTKEAVDGCKKEAQELFEKVRTIYKDSPVGNEVGGTDLLAGGTKGSSRRSKVIYDDSAGRYRDIETGRFIAQRNLPFPSNGGFSASSRGIIPEGTIVDRYGRPTGRYAGEPGATMAERGLPPGTEALEYHKYEVIEAVESEIGIAAEVRAFGARGGAKQYLFDKPIKELLREGILREVK